VTIFECQPPFPAFNYLSFAKSFGINEATIHSRVTWYLNIMQRFKKERKERKKGRKTYDESVFLFKFGLCGTFRRIMLLPSSGWSEGVSKSRCMERIITKTTEIELILTSWIGKRVSPWACHGNRNVGILSYHYTTSQPRRSLLESSSPKKLQNSQNKGIYVTG
jgi:hypothetical protein